MPEFPELEIVRKSLNIMVKQKKVKKVKVQNKNLRFKLPYYFSLCLQNKKIIKVGRFSKYFIIFVSDGSYCLIHLGMSRTIHIVSKKKN